MREEMRRGRKGWSGEEESGVVSGGEIEGVNGEEKD
jgi:hypothetical protein